MSPCSRVDCPLYKEQSGPISDFGNPGARLWIIGEAPGYHEVKENSPFVGASGKLLRKLADRVGINLSEAYITNVVRCRPPDNATPGIKLGRICSDQFLYKSLADAQPSLVLCLGGVAWNALRPKEAEDKRVTDAHGNFYWHDTWKTWLLPTFHPAAALRGKNYLNQLKQDLGLVVRVLNGQVNLTTDSFVPWKLVENPDTAQELFQRICHRGSRWSFDCETTGLNRRKDKITGIAFGFLDMSYFLPVYPGSLLSTCEIPWYRGKLNEFAVRESMQWAFSDNRINRVGHNAKFDSHFVSKWLGIKTPTITGDSMLAHHLLDENDSHHLKQLVTRYMGVVNYDGPVRKAVSKFGWADVPLDILAPYCAADAFYTLRLADILEAQLREQGREELYQKLVMPLSGNICQLESAGVLVDQEKLEERLKLEEKKIDCIKRKIGTTIDVALPDKFNIASPKQLSEFMFGTINLPDLAEGSTAENVLRELVSRSPKYKRFILSVLAFRETAKLIGTYLKAVRDKHLNGDGRVYSNYLLHGTVTGRLSSRNPNMQNIPKSIRPIFCAPPGSKLVSLDVAQAELAAWAIYSQDRNLIDSLNTRDIHRHTAAAIFGKSIEDITEQERNIAKTVTFAIIYGAEAALIAHKTGLSMSRAQKFIERLMSTFPIGTQWLADTQYRATKDLCVKSLMGRVRHLPDVNSMDMQTRAEALRQAVNAPVQMLASDLTNLGFVRLMKKLSNHQDIKPIIHVHDEIVFECPDEKIPLLQQTILETMQRRLRGVDFRVEIEINQNWGEKLQ